MNNENAKLRKIVYLLSVACSLLIGFIAGYFTYYYQIQASLIMHQASSTEFFPSESFNNDNFFVESASPRMDILFYNPGNEELWGRLSEISTGEGKIKGSIFINDKPADGIEVALVLAHGKKTKSVTVDVDGNFVIPIPKGKYFLNGVAIYKGKEKLDGKIFVNSISSGDCTGGISEGEKDRDVINEFDKLSAQFGPEEAARKMADNLSASVGNGGQFEFKVGKETFVFSPFHYRDPIKVLAPSNHAQVNISDLVFIWEPYPNASSYTIEIVSIEREGTITSYHPIISKSGITENRIDYARLIAAQNEGSSLMSRRPEKKQIEINHDYGYKIIAYNNKQEIISSTNFDFPTDFIVFTIK